MASGNSWVQLAVVVGVIHGMVLALIATSMARSWWRRGRLGILSLRTIAVDLALFLGMAGFLGRQVLDHWWDGYPPAVRWIGALGFVLLGAFVRFRRFSSFARSLPEPPEGKGRN